MLIFIEDIFMNGPRVVSVNLVQYDLGWKSSEEYLKNPFQFALFTIFISYLDKGMDSTVIKTNPLDDTQCPKRC